MSSGELEKSDIRLISLYKIRSGPDIPVSSERQERMIRKQINEITEGIETLGRSQSARFSVKQLEKTKRNLEAKLKKLVENPQRDDVVTFEELGIDKMFVDEAHSFKNLFLYTKIRNVAGIQQTEAQKSADLYMKCQYLDEITGGKGIVFATGTPIITVYQRSKMPILRCYCTDKCTFAVHLAVTFYIML